MNTNHRIDFIRVLIFLAIIFIYLNAFENNAYSSPDYSVNSPQINIEAIYQPEIPEKFQFNKGSFSIKQKKSHESYLEDITKHRKKLLFSIKNNGLINNPDIHFLSLHHIISILQKTNTWHQSSEDDHLFHIHN